MTTARIDSSQAKTFMDEAAGFHLRLPAGTVDAAASTIVDARVVELTAQVLQDALSGFRLPDGMRSLGRAFDIGVEVLGSPIDAFGRPAILYYDLDGAPLPTGVDPERVGFFQLGADGSLIFAGGTVGGGLLRTLVPGPGLYLLAEWIPSFVDMSSHWARADVDLMASKQVVRGLPDGRFDPEGGVTRAQFAAMLVRALEVEEELAGYADRNQASSWAEADLALVIQHGLMRGKTATTLAPQDGATRAEAAVLTARFWRR